MSIPSLSSSNSVNSMSTEGTPHLWGVAFGSPTPATHPVEIKEKTPPIQEPLPIEITPIIIPDPSITSSPKSDPSPTKGSGERKIKYYFLGGALALVGISLMYKKFFKTGATPQPKIKKITIPIESIKITSQNKV